MARLVDRLGSFQAAKVWLSVSTDTVGELSGSFCREAVWVGKFEVGTDRRTLASFVLLQLAVELLSHLFAQVCCSMSSVLYRVHECAA